MKLKFLFFPLTRSKLLWRSWRHFLPKNHFSQQKSPKTSQADCLFKTTLNKRSLKKTPVFLICFFGLWSTAACNQDDSVSARSWDASEATNSNLGDASVEKDAAAHLDSGSQDKGVTGVDTTLPERQDMGHVSKITWNTIQHMDDTSPIEHKVLNGKYRVLWSKNLGAYPDARIRACKTGTNRMALWGDDLIVKYDAPDEGEVPMMWLDASTGEIKWTENFSEAYGTPVVQVDEWFLGPSGFGAPYALKQNAMTLEWPFKKSLEDESRLRSELYPIKAREDGVVFHVRRNVVQSSDEEAESFQLIQSQWEGESFVIEQAVSHFSLSRQGMLLVNLPDGKVRARNSEGEVVWTYEVEEDVFLTREPIDLGDLVAVIVQAKTGPERPPLTKPGCEVRVLGAKDGSLVAVHPMWTSTYEQKDSTGGILVRGTHCGGGSSFNPRPHVAVDGEGALWAWDLSASWSGAEPGQRAIKVERIDLRATPVDSPANTFYVGQYFGRFSGTARVVGNGLLGSFTGFDSEKGERPRRYAKLVWVSENLDPVVLYTFENLSPEVDEDQGIYYNLSPCFTPPIVDSKGRIFVSFHERAWTEGGRQAGQPNGRTVRPSSTVLYALEPVK